MKKSHDLVTADPGDASVTLRLYAKWVDKVEHVTTPPQGPTLGCVWRRDDGAYDLALSVSRGNGRRQRHFVTVDPFANRPDRWHLVRLGPGVWDVPSSILVEGQLHAFVTLVGVPEPAPWTVPA